MELWQPLYIIRGGPFGVDFTPKLVWIALGVGLVVWDMRTKRRFDTLWVFLFGTLFIGSMEAYLQLSGDRIMPQRILFGQALFLPFSWLMQGIAEGATIALLALVLGDRIGEGRTRRLGIGLLCLLCVGVLAREWQAAQWLGGPAVYSRRNLLSPPSLLFLTGVLLFNLLFYIRRPAQRGRIRRMAGVLLLVSALWTAAQVITGGRWVELPGPIGGTYAQADWAVALAALVYSVVVEITLLLLTLYTLPAALGLIPDNEHRPAPVE